MLSVVGEEYIAYSESVKGQYTPMVAIQRYDGTLTYREIVREDLLRVRDDQILPGGWVFRKSQNTSSSWVKRYALIRGSFMFFFHSPQNEKPIAVVPLEDCTVLAPDMGHKTFDESRTYKANEGFEFDIRHNSRSTVRLYTLSEDERIDWMTACRSRIEAASLRKVLDGTLKVPVGSGNMVITSTKLTGLSLLPTSPPQSNHKTLPPLPSEPFSPIVANNTSYGQGAMNNTNASVTAGRPLSSNNFHSSSQYMSSQQSLPPPPYTSSSTNIRPPVYSNNSTTQAATTNTGSSQAAPYLSPQKTSHHVGLNKFRTRKDLGFEFVLLEENLKKKLAEQLEARTREAAAKIRLFDKEYVAAAQEKEAQNPLNLATLFRQSLVFIDEEVAEDPQEGTQLQMPHLKGAAIEDMLFTVYRRYCGESGFMSLEQFIEFFDDSAILHTHAPHNENDEPIEEYITLLDPVRLLTLVPRNIGFSVSESYDTLNDKLIQASKSDNFIINFSQFYMILLRVTQIVYGELFEKDATLAFNKLLQEVICPLFVWCKGHHKRGSGDVLVLEERILLLMITYAPNLYRVFLTYGHDAVNKVPEINRVFPETAQANEKGMFRSPGAAPASQLEPTAPADSIFMTELGCLRFARDYGITPYVSSIKQLREIYKTVNRPKVIVSARLPTRDMLQNKLHSAAQLNSATRKKELAPMKISTKLSRTGFGSSSTKDLNKVAKPSIVTALSPKKPIVPSRVPTSPSHNNKAHGNDNEGEEEGSGGVTNNSNAASSQSTIGGLGFSEFIEFVSRVAVEGMQQENYDVVFPTPFSKVLAMLTVWGVADLRKLEEVRIIHTEEVYQ